MALHTKIYPSPAGRLLLGASDGSLCLCDWVDSPKFRPVEGLRDGAEDLLLDKASQWLGRYFSGERNLPEIPISQPGTPFQKSVWEALRAIPYGWTVTYLDVALAIGRPTAVRAVANAIGSNRVSIFLPCHRVIGSNGSITGYSGGLNAKRFLLSLEAEKEPSLF